MHKTWTTFWAETTSFCLWCLKKFQGLILPYFFFLKNLRCSKSPRGGETLNSLCISSIIFLGVQLHVAIGLALDTLMLYKKRPQKFCAQKISSVCILQNITVTSAGKQNFLQHSLQLNKAHLHRKKHLGGEVKHQTSHITNFHSKFKKNFGTIS